MEKITTILFLLVVPVLLFAQPPDTLWTRTYGGSNNDGAYSVHQTADGGYVMVGTTESFGAGNRDFWLVKTGANGDSPWSRTFGGRYHDECAAVQQTLDGGYVLAGYTQSFGAGGSDFWLVRTDANGDSLWSRTFGGGGYDGCETLCQTADGGFVLAGCTSSFGAGSDDFCLVKTDGNGNQQWMRTFGGGGSDWCHAVQQTSDGGYILAGWTNSSGAGGDDFYLVKTDGNGYAQWGRTYGGSSNDGCYDVQQAADGGYVLAGRTYSYGAGNYDAWLVKTDGNGNQQWSRTFGGSNWDHFFAVQRTTDGGYIMAGYTQSFGAGNRDFWLVKADANGDSLWSRTFGGGNWDACSAVRQTADGGYLLAGTTNSFGAGNYDFWMVRTGPDVPPSQGLLTGVVRATDSTPLDSAIITLSPGSYRDTTDSQGIFQIRTINPGQYALNVTRVGYIGKDTLISIGAGSVTSVDITLEQEIRLIVSVLDENDELIPNSILTVRNEQGEIVPGAILSGGAGSGFRDDPQPGEFFVQVPEGFYSFDAAAGGYMDRYTNTQYFNLTPEIINTFVSMRRTQITEPTYIFLIRGITMVPLPSPGEDDGEEIWESFENAFQFYFGGDPHVRISRIEINTTGNLVSNFKRARSRIDSVMDGVSDARIILIGHSMGGIIARYYVVFGNRPVERIFTVDTPHLGSDYAKELDAIWNSCYYRRFFPCAERPYPAYRQLSKEGMQDIDSTLMPLEQSRNTKYILIASTHHEEGEDGDWFVNLRSQKGRDENNESVFKAFEDRVVEAPTFGCDQIQCSCWWPKLHNCAPTSSTVISYILNNLNTPIEDLQEETRPICGVSEPAPSAIWTDLVDLQFGTPYSDTFYVPSAAYFDVTTVGLVLPATWALETPTEMMLTDSASFANFDGVFGADSTSETIIGVVPSPTPGNWILHMDLAPGMDSAFVVASARAPVPITLKPVALQTVSTPGQPVQLKALAYSVSGVTVDSVVASFFGDSTLMVLNDAGVNGDSIAGDSVWSTLTDTLYDACAYFVAFISYGHAGSEQYRVQGNLEFVVEEPIAHLLEGVTWEPVDTDTNSLFELLKAIVPLSVDSSASLRLSATLLGPSGDFITAAQVEDSLVPGDTTLTLSFEGKHISDACVLGPYALHDVRLSRISSSGTVTLIFTDSLSSSPAYDYSLFEGKPNMVHNVGAVRTGELIEVFWTPHSDPDIEYFKVYYDTDGQQPYEGTGLVEGDSPVSAGNALSFELNGADSSLSYTVSVTAVDSAGSESDYSSPYTVFALAPPDPVDSLTIRIEGDEYVLEWIAVSGGAKYIVEKADCPDGPWIAFAQTYSTSLRRSVYSVGTKQFFRVIAER